MEKLLIKSHYDTSVPNLIIIQVYQNLIYIQMYHIVGEHIVIMKVHFGDI